MTKTRPRPRRSMNRFVSASWTVYSPSYMQVAESLGVRGVDITARTPGGGFRTTLLVRTPVREPST